MNAYLQNTSFLLRPSQECINRYTADTSQGIGRLATLNVVNRELCSSSVLVGNSEVQFCFGFCAGVMLEERFTFSCSNFKLNRNANNELAVLPALIRTTLKVVLDVVRLLATR